MNDERQQSTRQLFARARGERPSTALRARVLASGLKEIERRPQSGPRALRAPVRWRRRAGGVAAALALCAGALLALSHSLGKREGSTARESVASVAISAEPTPGGTHGASTADDRVAKRAPALEPPPSEAAVQAPSADRAAYPPAPPSQRIETRGGPRVRPSAAAATSPAAVEGAAESVPQEPVLAAPPASVAAPGAVAAPGSLGDQLAQLQRARAALRSGHAAQALELIDAYQLGGQAFGAEASLLRIEALAATGERARAAERARQFLRDYPNSPLVDRAQSLASELTGAGGGSARVP
jgi:hypothetical protein